MPLELCGPSSGQAADFLRRESLRYFLGWGVEVGGAAAPGGVVDYLPLARVGGHAGGVSGGGNWAKPPVLQARDFMRSSKRVLLESRPAPAV